MASVPFNPQTSKTERRKGEKREEEQLSPAQHNKLDCEVEFTSPQERNKQAPREPEKMHEYKKLILFQIFFLPY